MKNWYVVSFTYDKDVYCTNLCTADSKEQAEEHYSKEFEWVSVKAAAFVQPLNLFQILEHFGYRLVHSFSRFFKKTQIFLI